MIEKCLLHFLSKCFVYISGPSRLQTAKEPRVGIKTRLHRRARQSSSSSSNSLFKSNARKWPNWPISYPRERARISWVKTPCRLRTNSAAATPFWCSYVSPFCCSTETLLCAIRWITTRWRCTSTRWFAVTMWSVCLIRRDNYSPAILEDIRPRHRPARFLLASRTV